MNNKNCRDCNGVGEIFFSYGDDPDDSGYEPCSNCKGSGLIKLKTREVIEEDDDILVF